MLAFDFDNDFQSEILESFENVTQKILSQFVASQKSHLFLITLLISFIHSFMVMIMFPINIFQISLSSALLFSLPYSLIPDQCLMSSVSVYLMILCTLHTLLRSLHLILDRHFQRIQPLSPLADYPFQSFVSPP